MSDDSPAIDWEKSWKLTNAETNRLRDKLRALIYGIDSAIDAGALNTSDWHAARAEFWMPLEDAMEEFENEPDAKNAEDAS